MDEKIIKKEIGNLYMLFMEKNNLENTKERTEFQNKVLNSLAKIYKEVSKVEDLKAQLEKQKKDIEELKKTK